MSLITDVILCAHDTETAAIDALNTYLPSLSRGGGKLDLIGDSDHFGGSKVTSHYPWGGAFNYLDHEAFIDAVKAAPWRFRNQVVVIMWDKDDQLTVHELGES
jgi:hypothetical protein